MSKSICAVVDCEREARARGWCNPHYKRWRKHGDVLGTAVRDPYARLMDKVWLIDGHWIAQRVDAHGYGYVSAPGKRGGMLKAHRVTYEHHRGAIPVGLVIDHLCRVKACCNPDHLEVVTQTENCARIERDHMGQRWLA